MSYGRGTKLTLAGVFTLAAAGGGTAFMQAQQAAEPTNDAPNPYQTIENHFKLPAGRTWGSTSAIDISPDGRFIWVGERCGANSCLDRATGQMSKDDPILKFDQSGKLVASFGAGMMVFPHGIHVDREGNVWVTDGQDNAPQAARGGGGRATGASTTAQGTPVTPGANQQAATAGQPGTTAAGRSDQPGTTAGGGRGGAAGGRGPAPTAPPAGATIGHQVFKFSPEGKLLLTIGKPGGATGPTDCCWQPNDVITNQKGEIFISEGHGTNQNDRILKFTPQGKLITTFGRRGTGPGEFNQPHALAFDSQGRLFVGDRGNNRVQIMTQDFKFIADWPQFSRPSGLFIDRNDMLYSADSESGSVNPAHGAWKRGIRIGSVKDGKVVAFIPDPDTTSKTGTLAAEGVAVDPQGNIYGAEVGPRKVQKYVKK
jgi:hypothetical protein